MKIVRTPNDILVTPAKKVVNFDKKLQQVISSMKSTLIATNNPKGVGLAAPQVGIGLKIFLTRPTEKSQIRVFINPEIISRKPETKTEEDNKLEGCLSIPKIWGKVKRSHALTLKYQDETGSEHEEKLNGFIAVIAQHETDHLNGILFTQRVLEQREKLYQATTDHEGKEHLDEIKL